jgi:hypothetical protein
MDSRQPLLPDSQHKFINTEGGASRQKSKSRLRSRLEMAAWVILFTCFFLVRDWVTAQKHVEKDVKVPLDVHIM